ncbi:hypothetical protein BC830DRAFT_1131140 [Chytriomyces sp. MP71]|nr:hypothetical protein BC830DRAFT_1131140 [Chytriomyces sp. MP71]
MQSTSSPSPNRRPPGGFSTLDLGHHASVEALPPQTNRRSFGAFTSNVVFGDDVSSSPFSGLKNVADRSSHLRTGKGFGGKPGHTSLQGIFDDTAPAATSEATAREPIAIVPGHADELAYFKPGRRPGPGPRASNETPSPRTRRTTLASSNHVSQLNLAHDEGTASSITRNAKAGNISLDGSLAAPDVQVTAGRTYTRTNHNILAPPPPESTATLNSPRASGMKNRSSITFGESPSRSLAPSLVAHPQKRLHPTGSGNKSSLSFAEGGMTPTTKTEKVASRYTGKGNHSSLVFGDDGGPTHLTSKIPVSTRRFLGNPPGDKASMTFAEFSGYNDTSKETSKVNRVDPSTLDRVAGLASGKHRVF